MKKIMFSKAFLMLIMGALIFSSCKKKETAAPDDTSQQATTASDQSNVDTESNNALNDADIVVSGSIGNARVAASYSYANSAICNATIDSMGGGSYLITYHGKSADSLRNRSGTIAIQIGPNSTSKWSNAGSTITLTFTNYKVTKVLSGNNITINGTKTITNVNGGNWVKLFNGTVSSLTHSITGNLSLSFDGNTPRTWAVTKQRVVNRISSSVYTITVSGTGSANGYSNVAYTGTNRFGNTFTGVFSTPVVWEYNASWTPSSVTWIPVSGVVDHHGAQGGLAVTLGVDSSGNSVASGTKPYGYKLNWTGIDGKSKSAVIPY
jgi:hypothetical protein